MLIWLAYFLRPNEWPDRSGRGILRLDNEQKFFYEKTHWKPAVEFEPAVYSAYHQMLNQLS